ncbi:MAG: right-handed parallel beta-helix repeat-containing protein [Chloroflexota bacterium]
MRNIRIMSPEDRRKLAAEEAARRPRPASRLRDWLATVPILLLVPALILSSGVLYARSATATLTPDQTTVTAGATIWIDGSGFDAHELGTLILDGSGDGMPSYKASGPGSFHIALTLPTTISSRTIQIDAVPAPGSTPRATVQLQIVAATTATPVTTATPTPTATATPTPTATATPTPTATPAPAVTTLASPAPAPTLYPVLMLSPYSGTAGTNLKVMGTRFAPDSSGTVTMAGTAAATPFQVDASGAFTVYFPVPTTTAGDHRVTGTLTGNGSYAYATFNVVISTVSTNPSPAPTLTTTPTPAPTPTSTPTPNPTPTPATTGAYFVSASGSDSNAGTVSSPWFTLQKAANTVSAGALVYVRSGSYTGFSMSRSGTSTAPIQFKAYPGDARPTVAGNGRVDVIKISAAHDIVIDGFTIQGAAGGGGSGAGVRTENGAYRIVIQNNIIQNNHSYGVNVNNSTDVTVTGNEVLHNEEGIYVSRAGTGVRILNNRVHHQDMMVVNTSNIVNDDHGAVGIALVRTTGAVLVSGNQLWANRARSYDYGWDGGAFEIYAASYVTIENNTTWDNDDILETGTDSSTPCVGNVFRRNVSYGATTAGRSAGMFLRCGSNMVVANNVFHNLDQFVFSVAGSSSYNGAIDGLQIRNNVAVMSSGKVFGIESGVPSSVVINNNLVQNTGGYVGSVYGRGSTTSLATFTSWTGYEKAGIQADPRFASPSTRDYRLTSASPAIDNGVVLFGGAVPWSGTAPDMGRYEYGS